MRNSVVVALRGVLAGVAALAFVLFFLLAQLRTLSLSVLVGLLVVGVASLVAAVGPSAVRYLFGFGSPRNVGTPSDAGDPKDAGGRSDDSEEPEWWLARLEPALEDSWNTWSDVVLGLGLGVVGVGSLALLAVYPGDDPPIGLLVVGFLGINCALVSLAFAVR